MSNTTQESGGCERNKISTLQTSIFKHGYFENKPGDCENPAIGGNLLLQSSQFR